MTDERLILDNLVLPALQEWSPAEGACDLAAMDRLSVSGLGESALEALRADWPGVCVEAVPGPGCRAELSARSGAGAPAPVELPAQDEGYALALRPGSAVVTAREPAGLWYGLQTLAQLRECGESAPCGLARDWPALRQRGIHVDLKGYQPEFGRLLELCAMLARHKVNAILLEVEDKHAYACAPEVGIPSAYTPAQFRELGRFCRARSIEVIPKLQCLGHVDYLLKHERYRSLRENGHPYQYCPLSAAGLELWKGMASELMDAFDGHAMFHIGADEASYLGECPACRAAGRAEVFSTRVGACIDFVRSRGRRPLMWEDILRNLHGHLTGDNIERTWELGSRAELVYWAYGYGGRDNQFPFLERYLERGMKVWGASGFSGCGPSWIQNVPPLAERALNIAAWTRAARARPLQGVIATGWTRIASADPPAEAPEACWFPVLYAAELMWRGAERPLDAFCRAAWRALFGGGAPAPWVAWLSGGGTEAIPEAPEVARNCARLDLLREAALAGAHEKLRLALYEALHMYDATLGRAMPDYRLNLVRRRTSDFRASLEARSAGYRRALEAFYESATVEEVISSRLGRDAALAREAAALIERTREV